MRAAAASSRPDTHPLLWTLDIMAAFPSQARPYISGALRATSLPREARVFAKATWRANAARIVGAPASTPPVRIASGVTQGCPLSSTLFLVSFEPLLELLSWGVDAIQAFADDVGAVSSTTAALVSVPRAMDIMQKASALAPAPSNMPVVVLTPHLPEVMERARSAIAALPLPWSLMRVYSDATYLGALVGPTAGRHAWDQPLAKWRSRLDTISGATVSAASRLSQYRLRAFPALSCLAQIRRPPPDLDRKERVALERLMKFLHNALPTQILVNLRAVGIPAPPPPRRRPLAQRRLLGRRLRVGPALVRLRA